MAFLIILTYFIIGFVIGLFIYDYHCKDFNKKNREFKLTWEEYSRREAPGLCMAFAIILWPILAIIGACYFIFQYPLERIRERNGIK
jgi:uncharacterized membrane protein